MRILIVDDDPELGALLETSLVRDGHVVQVVHDLAHATQSMYEQPDVVVLDLSLPDGDGLQWCKDLRATGNATSILILTARSAVAVRVNGLDSGADDYMAKPFSVAELRARVRAIGRRRNRDLVLVHRSGDVELNFGTRRASRAMLPVELTTREWALLEALAKKSGRVVSRERILEQAWGDVTDAAGASLEVLVGRIRRKLGSGIVRTLRGEGYAMG